MNTNIKTFDILLIEDNLADAELALRALLKNHITNSILHLKDGEEACNFLFSPEGNFNGHLPKLILLDLKLPKVDGLQILKRLKTDVHTQFIPVVMLTSSRQEQDVIESYKLGANSYVTKPVEFDKFMAVVSELGLYWLKLNQPPTL